MLDHHRTQGVFAGRRLCDRGLAARDLNGVVTLLLAAAAAVSGCLAGCSPRRLPPARSGDVIQLEIQDKRLLVEVASDSTAMIVGLMNRTELPEKRGMLFIYRKRQELKFWMRNTLIPLSIAFLSDKGKILQIEHMKPKDETNTRSKNKVRFALEVNQGWFQRNGVRVGDSFSDFAEKVRLFRGG
jgi:uncharacterized membrane protein (UPF0127 family)